MKRFMPRMIDGKREVETSMTARYGEDWLDQCMDALRDPAVRERVRIDLKLNMNNDHTH